MAFLHRYRNHISSSVGQQSDSFLRLVLNILCFGMVVRYILGIWIWGFLFLFAAFLYCQIVERGVSEGWGSNLSDLDTEVDESGGVLFL